MDRSSLPWCIQAQGGLVVRVQAELDQLGHQMLSPILENRHGIRVDRILFFIEHLLCLGSRVRVKHPVSGGASSPRARFLEARPGGTFSQKKQPPGSGWKVTGSVMEDGCGHSTALTCLPGSGRLRPHGTSRALGALALGPRDSV